MRGVDLEILLLATPALSGMMDPAEQKFIDDYKTFIDENVPSDDQDSCRIHLETFKNIQSTKLDISLIGSDQFKDIKSYRPHDNATKDPLRVAVMHHHLLPLLGLCLNSVSI